MFGATFVLTREVEAVRAVGTGFTVSISGGAEVEARSVILAMGVSYERLEVPALAALEGSRRSLRIVAVRGEAVQRRKRLRRRRRELGGPGRGSPRALRRRRHARLSPVALENDVAVPLDEIEGKANIHVLEGTEVVDAGGTAARER